MAVGVQVWRYDTDVGVMEFCANSQYSGASDPGEVRMCVSFLHVCSLAMASTPGPASAGWTQPLVSTYFDSLKLWEGSTTIFTTIPESTFDDSAEEHDDSENRVHEISHLPPSKRPKCVEKRTFNESGK